MQLKELSSALRSGWWLILMGALVGVAVAAGVVLATTPLYQSRTQFFVSTTDSTSPTAVLQGGQFATQRVASYAQLITGEQLAQRVNQRLELGMSAQALAHEISATAVTDTVLIDVTVTDPSPRQAQRIAEAVGSEFTDLAAELEAPQAGVASPVKVTVTRDPNLPSAQHSPQRTRLIALGLVCGLFVGAAVAILRRRLDRSVASVETAADASQSPVFGIVPRDEAFARRHVMARNEQGSTAEAYRQLRTNLQFLNVDEPPKVIMVSSALPSEGKTTLALNLAVALAEAGRRTTLVEGDLRRPRVTRYLGIVGGAGLTNILAGAADLDDVLQTYGDDELRVLAAGPTPPNPSELLSSSHMFKLIDQLRESNDFVLIDAPPLLPVADASGLAVMVDGVVLSVRYGTTQKDQLRQARATLDRVGARTLGVVLNIVPPKADIAAAYGYGYGYDADRVASGDKAHGQGVDGS